jgi:hypothetical protein
MGRAGARGDGPHPSRRRAAAAGELKKTRQIAEKVLTTPRKTVSSTIPLLAGAVRPKGAAGGYDAGMFEKSKRAK